MTKYALKENGEVLAEGTLRDCWKALVIKYRHLTLNTVETFGVKIEATE